MTTTDSVQVEKAARVGSCFLCDPVDMVGELERLFDNAFLLSRLPTSAQNISPKAFVDKD